MEKKVSAIITTHNRVGLLKKAIESVLHQTYKNIELIVIDDCSDDETKKLCNSIKNLKYIYIPREKHKNGNYARNLGIYNSTGDYVAFLDDDDEWYEEKIEKQLKVFEKNTKCGMVYCGRVNDVNDGKLIFNSIPNNNYCGDCSKLVLFNILTTTSAMMFKKEALENVGCFDENVNYWQETELVIRIAQKYEIEFVDEPLIKYRHFLSDKKRLTNNVDGFLASVDYINKKHSKLIELLDNKSKNKRNELIYLDTANRLYSIGKKFGSRKFLFKAFCSNPCFKNFVRFTFNLTIYKRLKIKLFIKNIKGG